MCGHYLLADTAITPVWYVPLRQWKVMSSAVRRPRWDPGCTHLLKIQVPFPRHIQGREEVPDEPHEHGQVVGDDLGDVEVPECPHQHLVLRPAGVAPLQGAGHHQHRLDGPQAPVVVILRVGVRV